MVANEKEYEKIKEIFTQLESVGSLTTEIFNDVSSSLLLLLDINLIRKLAKEDWFQLGFGDLRTKVENLIESKNKPTYHQSLSYNTLLTLLSGYVFSEYSNWNFKIYFEMAYFSNQLDEMLAVFVSDSGDSGSE